MPRSERCASGAIASTVSPCLPWRKLLSRGAPRAGRAAPASGGSSGRSEPSKGLEPFRRPLAGLGERSKAASEALRTAARAWASDKAELADDRGRPGSAPPRGWAARAGRARRRGLMEAAGLGLAGAWGYGSSLEQSRGFRPGAQTKRPGVGDWKFLRVLAVPAMASGCHRKPNRLADFCPSAVAVQWQGCANSGHSQTVRRTGQVDPELALRDRPNERARSTRKRSSAAGAGCANCGPSKTTKAKAIKTEAIVISRVRSTSPEVARPSPLWH